MLDDFIQAAETIVKIRSWADFNIWYDAMPLGLQIFFVLGVIGLVAIIYAMLKTILFDDYFS